MACYELDLIGQKNQSNRVSDWDMDEYSEILDFKCKPISLSQEEDKQHLFKL